METLTVRKYGRQGRTVIVLHGGPGAPGCAALLAEGLAASFRVLEPFQRGSSDVPLTVSQHVSDLHGVIGTHCPNEPPALVGESWGAMLALAYAAAYPDRVGALVLVGCGTFDKVARARMNEIRDERIAEYKCQHSEWQSDEPADPLQRAIKWHQVTDDYDCLESPDLDFDMQACTETLGDMHRCEDAGQYPQAFSAISAPVFMVHGDYDPHPGDMIRASLQNIIPQLEYLELQRCGHSPWMEKNARDEFFNRVTEWLSTAAQIEA